MARSKIARAERNTRDHKRGKRVQPIDTSFKWLVSDDGYPSTHLENVLGNQVDEMLSRLLEEQRVYLEYEYDNESSWPFSFWPKVK